LLVLLYSGIDTLGLLNAPAEKSYADRTTFTDWCETYLLARLKSVDGQPLTPVDLYGARCGILHTSTAVSSLGQTGQAREIHYQLRDQVAINFGLNAKLEPTLLDIERFAIAFKDAGIQFLKSLGEDTARLERARGRALTFFRWGNLVWPSKTNSISI
jgi:hypothetical protein